MRHQRSGKKLGRDSAHRKALYANLIGALIEHGRIKTTITKAKAVKPIAEQMITLGRRGDLHARRQAVAFLRSKDVVHKLFAEVGPAFAARPGGYTRIVRIGPRQGDAAEMAYLELVDSPLVFKSKLPESAGAAAARTPAEPTAARSRPRSDGARGGRGAPTVEAGAETAGGRGRRARRPTLQRTPERRRARRRAAEPDRRGRACRGGRARRRRARRADELLAQAVAPSVALTATITAPASDTAASEVVKLVPKKRARSTASATSSSVTTTNAVSSAAW